MAESGRQPAAIVDLHGGPVAGLLAEVIPEWQVLAAQGYVVFAPDFRGSQLYGWQAGPSEPADARDVVDGVEWLVASGLVDPDRLGLRGHSYGAWLAARVLTETDRFRAAVLDGGCLEPEMLNRSPCRHTPSLVLHGERDDLPAAETLRDWLHRAGVETEFVVYPGEGHVMVEPENRADFWRRTLAWFEQHLHQQ